VTAARSVSPFALPAPRRTICSHFATTPKFPRLSLPTVVIVAISHAKAQAHNRCSKASYLCVSTHHTRAAHPTDIYLYCRYIIQLEKDYTPKIAHRLCPCRRPLRSCPQHPPFTHLQTPSRWLSHSSSPLFELSSAGSSEPVPTFSLMWSPASPPSPRTSSSRSTKLAWTSPTSSHATSRNTSSPPPPPPADEIRDFAFACLTARSGDMFTAMSTFFQSDPYPHPARASIDALI
jgi:hypothetical protein